MSVAPAELSSVVYPTESDPYYTIDGVRLVRVTNCLHCFPRPHLYAWYAKAAAERAVGLKDKWFSGAIDDKTFEELFLTERLMQAPFEYRDFKGDIGVITHRVGYDWALGQRVSESDFKDYLSSLIVEAARTEPDFQASVEAVLPYCKARIAFVELTQPEYEVVGLETVCVSWEHQYAGRADAFGARFFAKHQDTETQTGRELVDLINRWGDGKSAIGLLDDKCSNHQGSEWRYQLSAYANADQIVLTHNGQRFELPECQFTANLWVRPEGSEDRTRLIPQPCTPHEFEAFLAARDLTELINNPTARPRLSRAKSKPPVRYTERACPFGGS